MTYQIQLGSWILFSEIPNVRVYECMEEYVVHAGENHDEQICQFSLAGSEQILIKSIAWGVKLEFNTKHKKINLLQSGYLE
ncbi:hypothetical protein [Erysipelothrix aquatica]|uniref:hypothetical protein n=1 Tax=Erysipelothrix aquatica TaxID=2683714 RepID=UPI00135763B6|nr:hypothetical protein [Erysipelothrix aquatica]